MDGDSNYERRVRIRDDSRWVFEFTDACGTLEKALEFARLFKQKLAGFYMDGKVDLSMGALRPSSEYLEAGRLFWMEFLEGNKYGVPKEVIETLSNDRAAPFVVFGRLQSKAFQSGYQSGDRDFDDLSNDLASGGVLH